MAGARLFAQQESGAIYHSVGKRIPVPLHVCSLRTDRVGHICFLQESVHLEQAEEPSGSNRRGFQGEEQDERQDTSQVEVRSGGRWMDGRVRFTLSCCTALACPMSPPCRRSRPFLRCRSLPCLRCIPFLPREEEGGIPWAASQGGTKRGRGSAPSRGERDEEEAKRVGGNLPCRGKEAFRAQVGRGGTEVESAWEAYDDRGSGRGRCGDRGTGTRAMRTTVAPERQPKRRLNPRHSSTGDSLLPRRGGCLRGHSRHRGCGGRGGRGGKGGRGGRGGRVGERGGDTCPFLLRSRSRSRGIHARRLNPHKRASLSSNLPNSPVRQPQRESNPLTLSLSVMRLERPGREVVGIVLPVVAHPARSEGGDRRSERLLLERGVEVIGLGEVALVNCVNQPENEREMSGLPDFGVRATTGERAVAKAKPRPSTHALPTLSSHDLGGRQGLGRLPGEWNKEERLEQHRRVGGCNRCDESKCEVRCEWLAASRPVARSSRERQEGSRKRGTRRTGEGGGWRKEGRREDELVWCGDQIASSVLRRVHGRGGPARGPPLGRAGAAGSETGTNTPFPAACSFQPEAVPVGAQLAGGTAYGFQISKQGMCQLSVCIARVWSGGNPLALWLCCSPPLRRSAAPAGVFAVAQPSPLSAC